MNKSINYTRDDNKKDHTLANVIIFSIIFASFATLLSTWKYNMELWLCVVTYIIWFVVTFLMTLVASFMFSTYNGEPGMF